MKINFTIRYPLVWPTSIARRQYYIFIMYWHFLILNPLFKMLSSLSIFNRKVHKHIYCRLLYSFALCFHSKFYILASFSIKFPYELCSICLVQNYCLNNFALLIIIFTKINDHCLLNVSCQFVKHRKFIKVVYK